MFRIILCICCAAFIGTACGEKAPAKKLGAPKAQFSSETYGGEPRTGEAIFTGAEVKPVPKGNVHEVRLDFTHKEIEIADGVRFTAWTFGDTVPGPTVHVKQGDTVRFFATNRSTETAAFSPPMPHSIDFHAAMVNPKDKYQTVIPGQTIRFEWTANYPGVFMYHCGTPAILQHMIYGMVGMTIVEPADGWPTTVDREFALVQQEFYLKKMPDGKYETDIETARAKRPSHVAFNGYAAQYVQKPLVAKPGERVRIYVLNVGPNDTSSFHVVGTLFDRTYLDGNPANVFHGLQTILLGASNGAVVEFVIPEPGIYTFVDHEFADVEGGAAGLIRAE